MKNNIHCGACLENFNTIEELNDHIKICHAAIVLLPFINLVYFYGDRRVGHPIGSLISALQKNSHLIKRYVYGVAADLNSVSRSQLHQELCEKLYLDYKEFKPFDSIHIKKLPTQTEAMEIFWSNIKEKMSEML